MVALVAALTALGLAPAVSAAPAAAMAADQVLTWTGTNSVTEYGEEPATAVAGPATIVFENSVETGNTIAMSHTLTFDTSTPGYNHDVAVNILANPLDAQGGRYEVDVTLTPGTYRYLCTIPGHSQMVGELVVTGDGGGEEDTTAPTVTAEVTGEQDADGAYVGSATVTLEATDEGSGVASVEYSLDGGEFQPYVDPVGVDALGEHTLAYRATDEAGNVSDAGSVEFTVVASGGGEEDTTAPTVTAEVTGEQDADGAYVGSATVTLEATDEGSGVASVEYDAHGGHFMPYTEPVVISEPGEHTVAYRATDEAGNVSETGSVTFVVAAAPGEEDTTAPAVTAEVSGEQDADGAYVGSATLTLTATDAGSGVASTEYDLDGAGYALYTGALVVDEPGEHTVAYRATDEAGNVSEAGSVTFTVVAAPTGDTTAPQVTASVIGARDGAGEYVGRATVSLRASDEESEVASVEYQVDGGDWRAYTSARIVVTTAGEHTVAYRATDAAGNVSEPGSVTFRVASTTPEDGVAPEVSATVAGPRDASGDYVGRATVTIAGTDAGSGVVAREYQLDGGAWQRYAAPVLLVADGEHTIAYRATDGAGNVSATGSLTFTVVALRYDACPGSDVRPTVVIGTHDSTVDNVDTGDGCTINDLIDEDGEHESHRLFLRHVRRTTADLVAAGTISASERSRIVQAAVGSDVGR